MRREIALFFLVALAGACAPNAAPIQIVGTPGSNIDMMTGCGVDDSFSQGDGTLYTSGSLSYRLNMTVDSLLSPASIKNADGVALTGDDANNWVMDDIYMTYQMTDPNVSVFEPETTPGLFV